jgi:hypothetical protein
MTGTVNYAVVELVRGYILSWASAKLERANQDDRYLEPIGDKTAARHINSAEVIMNVDKSVLAIDYFASSPSSRDSESHSGTKTEKIQALRAEAQHSHPKIVRRSEVCTVCM